MGRMERRRTEHSRTKRGLKRVVQLRETAITMMVLIQGDLAETWVLQRTKIEDLKNGVISVKESRKLHRDVSTTTNRSTYMR